MGRWSNLIMYCNIFQRGWVKNHQKEIRIPTSTIHFSGAFTLSFRESVYFRGMPAYPGYTCGRSSLFILLRDPSWINLHGIHCIHGFFVWGQHPRSKERYRIMRVDSGIWRLSFPCWVGIGYVLLNDSDFCCVNLSQQYQVGIWFSAEFLVGSMPDWQQFRCLFRLVSDVILCYTDFTKNIPSLKLTACEFL